MSGHRTPSHQADQDWDPIAIKAALARAGWTFRSLAAKHRLHHSTLADALRRPYPASEKLIAKAIKQKPATIWPSRYAKKRLDRSTGSAAANVQRTVDR